MLSLPHLVVLFVIALVIFGPQKLPELARMLGKATAEFRKMSSDFRYALENEVSEMERQTRIREAEVASALAPVQPPTPQPEGTLARDVPTPEAASQPETVQAEVKPDEQVDANSSHATVVAVTPTDKKPTDDNTAV